MPVLISQRRIRLAVKRLARQLDQACRKQGVAELTVICVMDAGFIFTADLVREMRTPTRVIFLKATSYKGTRKGTLRTNGLPKDLRDKPMLVVDTIHDTGETIARVVHLARKVARTVWLAVLFDKHHKSAIALEDRADTVFVGIRIPGDPFLIGYGLDCDGEFRHLPDVSEHREPAKKGRKLH